MEFEWGYKRIIGLKFQGFNDHRNMHARGHDLHGFTWRGLDQGDTLSC